MLRIVDTIADTIFDFLTFIAKPISYYLAGTIIVTVPLYAIVLLFRGIEKFLL
ncbi:hypothetical protein GGQ92_001352 [Gracilibacillus halotolerans]|uniref:Uncharacterized protein n=1 Tax=Gracilibacillus halotolerans TaxID=74386 RepID=A0A841RM81_9BACI|nr:hypothetical protein [Gracilibacillus halotolerans]MBB6512566.1 hypothetical protein [Gracilibacillus halotolerans]